MGEVLDVLQENALGNSLAGCIIKCLIPVCLKLQTLWIPVYPGYIQTRAEDLYRLYCYSTREYCLVPAWLIPGEFKVFSRRSALLMSDKRCAHSPFWRGFYSKWV